MLQKVWAKQAPCPAGVWLLKPRWLQQTHLCHAMQQQSSAGIWMGTWQDFSAQKVFLKSGSWLAKQLFGNSGSASAASRLFLLMPGLSSLPLATGLYTAFVFPSLLFLPWTKQNKTHQECRKRFIASALQFRSPSLLLIAGCKTFPEETRSAAAGTDAGYGSR